MIRQTCSGVIRAGVPGRGASLSRAVMLRSADGTPQVLHQRRRWVTPAVYRLAVWCGAATRDMLAYTGSDAADRHGSWIEGLGAHGVVRNASHESGQPGHCADDVATPCAGVGHAGDADFELHWARGPAVRD